MRLSFLRALSVALLCGCAANAAPPKDGQPSRPTSDSAPPGYVDAAAFLRAIDKLGIKSDAIVADLASPDGQAGILAARTHNNLKVRIFPVGDAYYKSVRDIKSAGLSDKIDVYQRLAAGGVQDANVILY